MDIQQHRVASVNKLPHEVVERKGLGHPDTLSDGVAEMISIEYSLYCLKRFGAVLHHNVDKVSIYGGQAKIDYGIGDLKKPIRLILNGRMSSGFGRKHINLPSIQREAAKKYLEKILPHLDFKRDVEINYFTTSNSRISHWFSPRGYSDLPELSRHHANDTSTSVGFWPLSSLERMVLTAEHFFYTPRLKPKFNFVGGDIKVMGIRNRKTVDLILCVPFYSHLTRSAKVYEKRLGTIYRTLLAKLETKFPKLKIRLSLNTLDHQLELDKSSKTETSTASQRQYLVAKGSALDYGEEGMVGRGNRSRGLISSMRISSVEAACGKNPVYHVGKVNAFLASSLAEALSKRFHAEVLVTITSKAGDKLESPTSLHIYSTKRLSQVGIIRDVRKVFSTKWTQEILLNKYFLPTSDFDVLRKRYD